MINLTGATALVTPIGEYLIKKNFEDQLARLQAHDPDYPDLVATRSSFEAVFSKPGRKCRFDRNDAQKRRYQQNREVLLEYSKNRQSEKYRRWRELGIS